MDGLLRYNAIQSALSPVKKEKGWKLPVGGFQSIASKIYHKTKGKSLEEALDINKVLQDIPGDNPPTFSPELTEWLPFFAFDANAKNDMGKVSPEIFPEDLYFRSPQLYGKDDYLIDTSLLSYEDHFSSFSDYCNANRGLWWSDSDGAPKFRFTEPKYDWNEQKYYTLLEINDDNTYGYDPELGTVVNKDVKPQPLKEPEKEEKPAPASDKELEIRKIQAETELAKASTEKLSQLNKAVDRLDSQLDRGIITKEEYKAYLKRLYEL